MYDEYSQEQEDKRQRPPFQFIFGLPFAPPFGPPSPGPGPGPAIPPPRPPQGPMGPGGATPPLGPPPNFVPQQSVSIFAVDPGAIRPCLFRFVYIWPNRGRGFWAYLIFSGRNSVAGFRWTGFNWVYFGMDVEDISSFQCY